MRLSAKLIQYLRNDHFFIKWEVLPANLLVILMPFARQYDDITFLRMLQSIVNCRPSILHNNMILFFHPCENLLDDFARLFKPRVIRCNDDKICQPLGNLAHDGALSGIPVASAPENADQPALGETARCFERALQAIRLMRIIQNDAIISAAGIQPLKAPRDSRNSLYPLLDADHVHPEHKAHSNRRKGVIDTEHSRRLQQNGELRPLFCHDKTAACASKLDSFCHDMASP